jgi:hypothetical protein
VLFEEEFKPYEGIEGIFSTSRSKEIANFSLEHEQTRGQN